MDQDYRTRETNARRAAIIADNEFKRQCASHGVSADDVGAATAAIDLARTSKLPAHPSGILAPIRPWR